jgi:hypothetical protein
MINASCSFGRHNLRFSSIFACSRIVTARLNVVYVLKWDLCILVSGGYGSRACCHEMHRSVAIEEGLRLRLEQVLTGGNFQNFRNR